MNPVNEEKRYTFMVPSDSEAVTSANNTIQSKLDHQTNPLRIAEMAIEIQLEKLRVAEAMNARDALVQRLTDAYTSIREKTEIIEKLQQILSTSMTGNGLNMNIVMSALYGNGPTSPTSPGSQQWEHTGDTGGLRSQITDLEGLIQDLRLGSRTGTGTMGPPPRYEEEERKIDSQDSSGSRASEHQTPTPTFSPVTRHTIVLNATPSMREERSIDSPVSQEPEDMVKARFSVLLTIPLPVNPPDDTLKPIVLPPACTLHEFLSGAPAALRNSLGNYRVLQSLTTKWCPSREEHGYFYSPLFKCSTNPRVTTAHRWQPVDVTSRMKHPTECFYNREGLWYYAGSYQAFRLEDLTVKEWAELSTETANHLVKETIAGRKNVSPQNIYEVNQLYNAGALKIACVGLQCVGFNQDVYKSVLDHAAKFSQSKWKNTNTSGSATNSPAIGTTITSTSINKPGGTPSKATGGVSTPVSPISLASAGFGAVAAGLGLGNGTAWNTTASVLCQTSNAQVTMHPANGNENMQPNVLKK